jgi:AraC-like DNA-binding protein
MNAEGFEVYYREDEIANEVLWENHCHAHFELIAVVTGDVRITSEGREYRLRAGDAILLPPLCYHIVSAGKKCTYRRLTAAFDEGALPRVLCERLSLRSARPFRADGSPVERLRALCTEENEAFYAPLAGAFMLELLYACAGAREYDAGIADPVLHTALLYIEKHLCEPLTLDEIAAAIPVSKSLLCHRFREQMKTSPKQYILQKRMTLAAKLIREGVPPTKVALRVGYENYSNFYRMYQKHAKNAPSDG